MDLIKEIEDKTKEFKTDSLTMSIGELTNLYKDGEIIINPEFQRYFRWSTQQKSKLIESILLGIPIPPIFVYQKKDGIWEVVDGLQRLSTIFEFCGLLKEGAEGSLKSPLVLDGTKLLPCLEGVFWQHIEENPLSLPESLRLHFKRAKLRIEIIQKESDADAKFEVFQRLNTGGSSLSYQEVRSCLLIMINKPIFTWLKRLSAVDGFLNCIVISDRLLQEQYDMELVLRYFSCTKFSLDQKDVNEFLTDSLLKICKDPEFDLRKEEEDFTKLFTLLDNSVGEGCFKKFDGDVFKGKFLESAYEAITMGLYANLQQYSLVQADYDLINLKIKSMWSEEDFTQYYGSGSNARTRIPRMRAFGERHFLKQ